MSVPRLPKDIYAECDSWGEDRVRKYVDSQPEDAERLHRLEWLVARLSEQQSLRSPDWLAVPDDVQRALLGGWSSGMPHGSSALYARWWQLETWLRSLIYVELKVARGASWGNELPKVSELRQERDGEFHYMPTPDVHNQLAYADASALFKITLDHWDLFSCYFPSKVVWAGRIEELLAIRNRIGHCRRPHTDDLVRLEQTLRDLDAGAFAATSAFNNQWLAAAGWTDDITAGWVHRHHQTAGRLIEHAEKQYDTSFELRFSRRPWASSSPSEKQSIAGMTGYVWHAFWYFRRARPFHLDRFWRDTRRYHDSVLMVCAESPSSVSVSFSAVEDSRIIADAIGCCFDAALYAIGQGNTADGYYTRWMAEYSHLDPRVQVGATPWALVEASMRGVSIFGA